MKLFNTGVEQANLVLTSNIPELLWNGISEVYKDVHAQDQSSLNLGYNFRFDGEKQCSVVTFVTWPAYSTHQQLLLEADLVSSSSQIAKESFALFEFLRKRADFAVNRAAITLFDRHRDQLSKLKDQIDYNKPIIVTGHFLGGAVASLFTLWLLERVNFLRRRRPICVTFGSPLIGDCNLQEALSQYSTWNSCFLHVVSNHDPVPRKCRNQNANDYKPFGTFLLCSDSGCSCFEEPNTILELLKATASQAPANQGLNQVVDYGKIVEHLKRKALFKNVLGVDWATSLHAVGIVTQLSAIEYQKEENEHMYKVVQRMEKQEKKFLLGKSSVNSNLKLNEAKINMAKLEWYKKTSNDKGIGYYDTHKNNILISDINIEEIVKRLMKYCPDLVNPDKTLNESKINMAKLEWYKKSSNDKAIVYYETYKNKRFTSDVNVEETVKRLKNFWSDVDEEADKHPMLEAAALRSRWLFAGINYRRMVEPLYIAEYYHGYCLLDYENQGRLRHFVRLEDCFSEIYRNNNNNNSGWINEKRKNVSHILTKDSLFWAKVEAAITSCELLKKEEASVEEKKTSMEKLKKFEDYVLDLLENYDVSPEIFLEHSSFMQWWRDYKEAVGRSYSSSFTKFMVDRKFKDYSEGKPLII